MKIRLYKHYRSIGLGIITPFHKTCLWCFNEQSFRGTEFSFKYTPERMEYKTSTKDMLCAFIQH